MKSFVVFTPLVESLLRVFGAELHWCVRARLRARMHACAHAFTHIIRGVAVPSQG